MTQTSASGVTIPRVTIDADALRNNLAVVRKLAPASRVIAVIKANAYGHGLLRAAQAFGSADALGVARTEEALALRDAGVGKQIVLLEGVFNAGQLAAAAQRQLDIVVHSPEQIAMLDQYRGPHRFAVWLKLNTGMNRLGLRAEEFAAAHQHLSRSAAVAQLRAMTHFASAEQPDDAITRRQLQQFRSLTDSLGSERSAANSAGVIAWRDAHFEWVRPGLMLYGISPMDHMSAATLGLQPAMTLTTQLIAINKVGVGEAVGYNGIWSAQRPSAVGIAAIGYGDGYPRGLRHGSPVLIRDREVPVVGRVSMDMIAIDLTDLPDAKVGDAVTLWGRGLPVERIAACANTIGYELVCRVTPRVAVDWKGPAG